MWAHKKSMNKQWLLSDFEIVLGNSTCHAMALPLNAPQGKVDMEVEDVCARNVSGLVFG